VKKPEPVAAERAPGHPDALWSSVEKRFRQTPATQPSTPQKEQTLVPSKDTHAIPPSIEVLKPWPPARTISEHTSNVKLNAEPCRRFQTCNRSQNITANPESFIPPISQGSLGTTVAAISLLTVKEVATLLRVSTDTVYGLCTRGELPHVRVYRTRFELCPQTSLLSSVMAEPAPRLRIDSAEPARHSGWRGDLLSAEVAARISVITATRAILTLANFE